MQLRVDLPNAKSIKLLAKDYKRTKGRKKSYAAIGNELIRDGLEKRTLPTATTKFEDTMIKAIRANSA